MSTDLFRKQAVRATLDPDRRGGLLQLKPPSGLAPLLVVAGLLGVAVAIAITCKVQLSAGGRGVIVAEPRAVVIRAEAAGVVRTIVRAPGDQVRADEVIVTTGSGAVTAPIAGRIEAIDVPVGESLRPGDVVARLAPEGSTLVGRLALPSRQRARVQVGDAVRLALEEFPDEEAGVGSGRVARIGEGAEPGSFTVDVALERMPPGAAGTFRAGMAFGGEVVLREERIVTVLFPGLLRLGK